MKTFRLVFKFTLPVILWIFRLLWFFDMFMLMPTTFFVLFIASYKNTYKGSKADQVVTHMTLWYLIDYRLDEST